MYKKSKKGNSKPGWYAGSNMVRKISQGNPRLFINIMCSLFEESCKTHLTPKAQHGILKKYAHEFCQSSQAIEKYGPLIYNGLEYVSGYLHNKTHNGVLRSSGNSFTIGFDAETFTRNKGWLQRAIAYSRLIVDSDSIINGLNADTKYTLSNAYAAEYWIPMRKDSTTKVPVIDLTNTYRVRNQITNEDHNNEHKLSLFIDQEELN